MENPETNPPKITVLMPVYNEKAAYLNQAIESILAQTQKDFELLIVDDGSTDRECLKTLDQYARKDPRIRLVRNQKNIRLTKTLNIGLSLAKGEFVARLDSDDFSQPKRLEEQLKFMDANPDCVLCGSWAHLVDEKDKIVGEKKSPASYEAIKKGIIGHNFFTHSTWFFKKDVIQKYGGYSEKAVKTEDYDLLLKLIPRHRVANIPQFLGSYRINQNGISFKDNKEQEKYSIIARFNALKNYGYPKIYFLKIIPGILMYLLLPSFLKQYLIRWIWKN
jgi:glycosyltransferase involved in cell wall biosynthesis